MSQANEQREAPELEAKVTFRLTPEEKRKLQADADSLGVSLGALVRRLCAEGTGRARPKSQRVASPGDVLIAKELNRVGNNLNQAVKIGHQQGFAADSLKEIRDYTRQVIAIARQRKRGK